MLRKSTLVLLLAALFVSAAQPNSYETLKREAEKYFAEKSFARAKEVYERASALQLSADERRWVEFRIADAALRDGDEAAREKLEAIVRGKERDRVFAEASEALGDYYVRRYDVGQAQRHYAAALDWWAGSDELALARQRYLAIVFRAAGSGNVYAVPREMLVNALAIAESKEDLAHIRFLLASQLGQRGGADAERALELLEAIIAEGKTTEWYDDALWQAASLYARGQNVVVEDGTLQNRADFARALELYRRLVSEYAKGESPWRDDAQRAIDDILAPSVSLAVGQTFLPGSEQEAILSWRNVKAIELTLTAVDLTKDVRPARGENQWTDAIATEQGTLVRRWTHETNDKGDHEPGMTRLRLTPRLKRGAYVLAARANGKSARQLVLVSDAHILVHTSPSRMEVFVSDVLTGEPIPNARVWMWQHRNDEPIVRTAQANANGLASIDVPASQGSVFVTAASGNRQAMLQTYAYGSRSSRDEAPWKIYAFTDRPAYRPEETVQWKIIARRRDREQWATPANESLTYEIHSPRGEKVASGEAKLNAFGSFWSELPLTASMPLGVYTVNFRAKDIVGSAPLFRLEEYKLPEFLVNVRTPKLYRLGETIEATIETSYYFGGPVANATVEAVIYQQPYIRYWFPWREFPWYYDAVWSGGSPMVLKRETLKTDADGRAVVRIETQRDGGDKQFRIEARVVDASRREVRGEGNVRVMKQRYSVGAFPEHYIHRPGEQVEVEFHAMDANDQPVKVEGTVKVTRRKEGGRPVRPLADRMSALLYADEEVTNAKVTTNDEGKATFSFTPRKEGYYAIRWSSHDRDPGKPVRARDLVTTETAVWVADKATTDLGYRTGGGALEIIADKETLKPGETANLMLVTPASGRWVLLTAMGDDILGNTQVIRLDGTVKLVQMPIDRRHTPNFFVTASSMFDRVLSTDTERFVVPPVEHFVTVDVKTDREEYEPRDEGTVTITTKDASGRPVAAEVSLAVSDEAVTAIQQDLAIDPRQFFFGEKRQQRLVVAASVQYQHYVRLIEGEDRQLIDDRSKDQAVQYRRNGYAFAAKSGVVGGMVGNARSEAITVTADAPMMPRPAPPPAAEAAADMAAPQEAAQMSIEVRTDFRSTAFWKPDVTTDASGTATVQVRYPEALTTWRATARAATAGAQFGMASSTVRTNMPLIVRLQAPRFFVAGDRTVVSAVINNNTDEAMQVAPSIAVEGLTLSGGQAIPPVLVPAHGEQRVDWTVVAEKAGPAKLRVTGRGPKRGDAMEKSFVVYEHGIDKLIARSGKLRGDEALVRLDLPRERRATELVVQVAPSLAVTMLDALPYLIQYPYGCTEQTMSRFLPAAIVARTLRKMGLDARARIPKLDDVTKQGMARLYDMQHAGGGWGWWKDGSSDVWMTAYVVWGFALARDAGLDVDRARIERAMQWLDEHVRENEGDWNTDAWILHAMSAWNPKPTANAKASFDDVWKSRELLTAYSRALLALTAHRYGDRERATVLVRNLENGAQVDRAPDQWRADVPSASIDGGRDVRPPRETTAETMATVHWGAKGHWWNWEQGPVESTAFVLQALVTIDPNHKYVEPAMNWLVKNRRGAQWSNTRDTAISVLAFDAWLRATGETARDVSYEITVNGRVIATKTVTAEQMLAAPSRFPVDDSAIDDAQQEIRIRRTSGSGPLYFSAEARFVSLEEPVKAAGNELFVRREYFRLAPRPTLLKGVQYDRVPLRDRESIRSGERVEVVVTIETKNAYEYLIFEDLKPAGFEAVALQSGEPLYATGKERSAWVYQELRDRKVAMFIDHLAQGVWEIRYTLRAETPGSFHALPLLGHAMYVPDIRANGDEVRVTVD
ncbi:MAG TPA: alpha-2-macroglobulin family protein [Thermoanaerobaculia bacterium]|nr:alpha-2-macroglobulin family protein [Thermoanaerobaculia bacterium]